MDSLYIQQIIDKALRLDAMGQFRLADAIFDKKILKYAQMIVPNIPTKTWQDLESSLVTSPTENGQAQARKFLNKLSDIAHGSMSELVNQYANLQLESGFGKSITSQPDLQKKLEEFLITNLKTLSDITPTKEDINTVIGKIGPQLSQLFAYNSNTATPIAKVFVIAIMVEFALRPSDPNDIQLLNKLNAARLASNPTNSDTTLQQTLSDDKLASQIIESKTNFEFKSYVLAALQNYIPDTRLFTTIKLLINQFASSLIQGLPISGYETGIGDDINNPSMSLTYNMDPALKKQVEQSLSSNTLGPSRTPPKLLSCNQNVPGINNALPAPSALTTLSSALIKKIKIYNSTGRPQVYSINLVAIAQPGTNLLNNPDNLTTYLTIDNMQNNRFYFSIIDNNSHITYLVKMSCFLTYFNVKPEISVSTIAEFLKVAQ